MLDSTAPACVHLRRSRTTAAAQVVKAQSRVEELEAASDLVTLGKATMCLDALREAADRNWAQPIDDANFVRSLSTGARPAEIYRSVRRNKVRDRSEGSSPRRGRTSASTMPSKPSLGIGLRA